MKLEPVIASQLASQTRAADHNLISYTQKKINSRGSVLAGNISNKYLRPSLCTQAVQVVRHLFHLNNNKSNQLAIRVNWVISSEFPSLETNSSQQLGTSEVLLLPGTLFIYLFLYFPSLATLQSKTKTVVLTLMQMVLKFYIILLYRLFLLTF